MKHLLIAVTLVFLAGLAGPAIDAVPCPSEFSSCVDVLGKSCRLGTGAQCTTSWTGLQSCTLPDESEFECPAGFMIYTKACPCRTRLQNICCPEGDCSFGECGNCESQPGSQELVCIPCGPCTTHYCTGEGVGCQYNGTCGASGCCNYTCNVSIPSCTGVDPCPSGACSCN